MKKISYLIIAAITLLMTSCYEEPAKRYDRDAYCGTYLLDMEGSVMLKGEPGTAASSIQEPLDLNKKNVNLRIDPIESTTDMVISNGYWMLMKGTCKKYTIDSHYLQFEDKVETNTDYDSGGNSYKWTYTLHNRKAQLTENNSKLTWLTDLQVDLVVNGKLKFSGSSTITNRAVKL